MYFEKVISRPTRSHGFNIHPVLLIIIIILYVLIFSLSGFVLSGTPFPLRLSLPPKYNVLRKDSG